MTVKVLQGLGVRSGHLQSASLGSILLCVALWIRAKTVDQERRGNAERRALFVGLWPPTLWLIGEELERHEPRGARDAGRRAARAVGLGRARI